MRTILRCALLAIVLSGGGAAQAALAQSGGLTPVGTWLTEDGRAKIKMEHCGAGNARLCGFVAWMKDAVNEKGQPRTDLKNPDPAKRSRPSLGLELMTELKADDPAHYVGEIYNAEDGKMYSVTIGVDEAEKLQVKGCILRYLCGSQTWTRVADLPVPNAVGAKMATTSSGKGKAAAGSAHPHDTAPSTAPATTD